MERYFVSVRSWKDRPAPLDIYVKDGAKRESLFFRGSGAVVCRCDSSKMAHRIARALNHKLEP